ncbi:SAYSvFN domain-containing protein 1 [Ditylenchus destructor]|uniref:SAYSvFN domain-containing protein 1 n=1 Tax=Ditylenchus destructor TaxID=166010 RepID=A0AAD4R5W8_9BILA|nr:SAYSvFN domain-containing protein 1 [Ditylenchus destructor]
MRKAQESLLEYRRQKKATNIMPGSEATQASEHSKQLANSNNQDDLSAELVENVAPTLNLFDIFAIDCLNCYPMRKWREMCARHPVQCWVGTGCLWLAGQILFAKWEFGLVYLLCSMFILMFLNLGVRMEGEMSAYSVFNPNCERLLGQMTEEHFQRDVLQRRAVNA